jgi:hypothetical protein
MNNNQIVNMGTKLLVAACAGVATKYGFSQSELQDVAVDAVTFVVGIGSVIFAHFHLSDAAQKQPGIGDAEIPSK